MSNKISDDNKSSGNKYLPLKKKTVALYQLGCDKNRVDAEKMLYNLTELGMKIAPTIEKSDLIIVNTCAFIKPAIVESKLAIDKVLCNKKKDAKVIVTGCVNTLYQEDFKNQCKGVDAFVKLSDNDKIGNIVCDMFNVKKSDIADNGLNRIISTYSHYAYLKISDGCNNFCSYCTIPMIRGRYKSEPLEKLIKEAGILAERGVKELILIAQDVTRYGQDINLKLTDLIRELSKINGIEIIRLHYCYPEMVDEELINEIVTNPKVAKYLDIPLQHISDRILKLMNRKGDSASIKQLVTRLHQNNIAIRSSIMVGFPTETKQDFAELKAFLKEYKLEYVGFFAYSREYNTKAYDMEQVPESVKKSRLKDVQNLQSKILFDMQKSKVGSVVDAIIDGKIKENLYLARSTQNSPEVDTYIYLDTKENLEVGRLYKVLIKKAVKQDLRGVIYESSK